MILKRETEENVVYKPNWIRLYVMLDQKQDSAATEENDPEISQSWRTGGRHFWLHPVHARPGAFPRTCVGFGSVV